MFLIGVEAGSGRGGATATEAGDVSGGSVTSQFCSMSLPMEVTSHESVEMYQSHTKLMYSGTPGFVFTGLHSMYLQGRAGGTGWEYKFQDQTAM